MHIHILGICGTFMGGLAVIAKQLGYKVTGSDANVYPPMSTQLQELGIELMQGYKAEHLQPQPDLVIIGNAMSRGNEAVETVLNKNIPYISGPQWLLEHVLKDKWVLAVSGTHGKTTTTSMLSWVLDDNGMKPGFLIGGIANNFGISARLGDSIFFCIEADEYDSAFFDKRSKFVHYRPRTLIMNNLEFDHADIFADLAAIQKQFHHLIRTVPGNGLVLYPHKENAIQDVIDQGCWTETQTTGFSHEQGSHQVAWQLHQHSADFSQFDVIHNGEYQGTVKWTLMGEHNANNALMAIAAAKHVGVRPSDAIDSLARFENVKRRMELKGEVNGIRVIDDFAHHPTAIQTTLKGLKSAIEMASEVSSAQGRIIAVLEPRSATMKLGVHKQELANSLQAADHVFLFQPENINWSVSEVCDACQQPAAAYGNLADLISAVVSEAKPSDTILIMSNGGFGGIHQKLLDALAVSADY
ncbi:UDP-N-acetylmuramate:L-alanyl-gamma-D-glutamyl-meso-diaminopimelate ligase [Saccharobesus litoralis]|uniref:UDP-N-acetylmuramate--L-alanyl-gamma-D-glutamyl-meso-2,6-diaminoheptandioate ligase n=1 Tax=Saccharobesus litoralis TaxID=2172099 RepID=A0A2S0VMM0_9ALTE|nr:UDP-N-acetylmuramate:L-alanyl-gamma-D-glutamyl-meso-diaminopimelate ligase [Saccharobesus litoralis]AWB65350.1 UDP-N-acetylmuramate:L-alanyl-gamma-D-glutamyl-meso-diaminopimelate ligase [Saccharobesus litoralis]